MEVKAVLSFDALIRTRTQQKVLREVDLLPHLPWKNGTAPRNRGLYRKGGRYPVGSGEALSDYRGKDQSGKWNGTEELEKGEKTDPLLKAPETERTVLIKKK